MFNPLKNLGEENGNIEQNGNKTDYPEDTGNSFNFFLLIFSTFFYGFLAINSCLLLKKF